MRDYTNKNVCLISIGQSPRNDISSVIRRYLPSGIDLFEVGALDGLNEKEINSISTSSGEILITKLLNGEEVSLDKNKISQLIQEKIDHIPKSDVDAFILACTSQFKTLKASVPVIFPYKTVKDLLDSNERLQKIGVIMPSKHQKHRGIQKWGGGNRQLFFGFHSPYKGEITSTTIGYFNENQVDIILLDCMGFNQNHVEIIKEHTETPIIMMSQFVAETAVKIT